MADIRALHSPAPRAAARRASLLPAFAIALALLDASAAAPAWGAEPKAGSQAYTLAPGDRVAITIFGQPELSGDFLIDGTGELLLALVGAVPAADVTLAELQKRIVERLADGYMQDPKVSIRVAEFRPIYIVGDVRAPGSYPYRHGMSVLTALAVAGGMNITEERQELLRNEIAQAEERVRSLTAGYYALLARRGRLLAQRDGATRIEFPPILQEDADAPHLQEVLEGERQIMNLQRKAQAQELELLRQQVPRARSEAQSIASQRRQERVQLELVQSQIVDMTKLTAGGLARRANLVELQREEARILSAMSKGAAEAARVDQVLGELEVKVQELENGQRRRIMTELQDTQVRLMEVEASLHGAREARDLKLQRSGLMAGMPSPAGRPASPITILNYEKDALASRPATETTLLRPGDIVRIEVALPGRSRMPPMGPASTGPAAGPAAIPAIGPVTGVGVAVGAR